MTVTSTVLAVMKSGDLIREPSTQTAKAAASLHALAFSSKGHLLLNESQGKFDFDTWEKVYQRAFNICHGMQNQASDGDIPMVKDVDGQPIEALIRETVEDQVYRDYAWKIQPDTDD